MNITERNIWKLNNLPPMEYCSLARAQKLLNCELEDILHWHDIGAINLCLKLNPTRGTLKIAVLSHQEKDVTAALNPLAAEAVETFWSPHSHIRSILRLDGDIPMMETLRGNTVTQFNVKVSASGLWHPHCRNLMALLEAPDDILNENRLSMMLPDKPFVYCHFIPDEDEYTAISLSRIYITSQAIEKIYAHSISARPMDVTKNSLLEQTSYIHQELTVLPQNEVLLEFIHYLIQSHTVFNEKLQNMAEPDKTQLFHHVLERLKEEGMLRENTLPDEADILSEADR
ncbi:hypothetical protein SB00094_02800 [Klebsiella variicola subsp. tropica]|uniref:hypothetical protein n=1 Tax=Klebsiella TaxID=570 RepID=UPI0007D0BCE0|nr:MULTISPECIES: hypothetical protein [Klebsiella]PJX36082.1 hypothetical protein CWM59_18585 [Klebsiella sp. B-Nf7]PJX48456.1 hypothetical protein CWM60_09695 [Klebsiella sp. C1-16S-Nf17]UDC27772.1 hypothetical protein LGN97_21035 [Klebsiella variicola subsp. tropica]SBN31786.1 conserved hypothetical protein [Klebsiella variicola]VGP57378.1 hypothetical protein SB00094_02800 [Klebsiella variicola subsp. tropica]